MRIMDASFRTRRMIEQSLHEIDRRALNAMVLVKRHGNKLASYGVVAQAFREQAVHLKEAATPLQHSIAPLVRVQMRILQQRPVRGAIPPDQRGDDGKASDPRHFYAIGGRLAARYRRRKRPRV